MTRAEVEALWLALIEGKAGPEQIRAWAEPWVRDPATEHEPSEPGVDNAVYILHGLTGPNRWAEIQSDREPTLRKRLEEWKAENAEYDADPIGFKHRRAIAALRGIARDHPDKAPRVAAILLQRGQLTDADVTAILG